MKGAWIKYSTEEMDFVRNNCTLIISDLHAYFCREFCRTDISARNISDLRKRNKWRTGRSGQFKKGHDGYKGGPGGPNKTSFKEGHVPSNIKPLGSERLNKSGYIEIKVAEKNPHTGAATRYRLKHQWVWEQHHGEVQRGYILHFIDGDRTNCAIQNLESFPRGVGAIMNKKGYSSLPDELKPVVKTLAKLQYKQGQLTQKVST